MLLSAKCVGPYLQILLPFVICGDFSLSRYHSETESLSTLMRKRFAQSISADECNIDALHKYINGGAGMHTDPCTWRGIECTAKEITSLIMTAILIKEELPIVSWSLETQYVPWKIDMDWLPPTLRVIHLNRLVLEDGWVAERLPRELRYLNVIRCNSRANTKKSREVRLHRLPRKLVELFVHEGWYSGKVLLIDLPKSLQILALVHESLEKVYVDSTQLPKSLRRVIVFSTKRLVKVTEIADSLGDSRIRRNTLLPQDFTKRYLACSATVKGYLREMRAESQSI